METNSPGNQKNIFLRFLENKLFQLSAFFLSQNLPANDANCVRHYRVRRLKLKYFMLPSL